MIHGYYTNKCVVTIYTDELDVLDMVFTIGWGNYFIDIKRKTSSCIGYFWMVHLNVIFLKPTVHVIGSNFILIWLGFSFIKPLILVFFVIYICSSSPHI